MPDGRQVPIALTIAGSDPSGGAGLQADLKTFHRHGVYGASVVTLLTVQNTRGVSGIEFVAPTAAGARMFVRAAIAAPAAVGHGVGPVDHFADITPIATAGDAHGR
jgi:hydroxymethylpyrimidine/phosphomethylpyrimidine kinase